MLTPAEILKQAEKKYPAFLRAIATGDSFFPLRIRSGAMGKITDFSKDSQSVEALRAASRERTGKGFSVEWREVNTRQFGRQVLPDGICFASEDDFTAYLGKTAEVARMRADLALIRRELPQLELWLPSHCAELVEFHASWPGLLKVCHYFIEHPRPNHYIRELPIAVHTKFVEQHSAVLRSLLDALLPTETITPTSDFERRFGLRYDEPLVRWRFLDADLQREHCVFVSDMAVPHSEFAGLPFAGVVVVVTENKRNYLALPPLPRAIGIWGGGGAVALLETAAWLDSCRLIYWGDIDATGLQLLARLRRRFPATVSVMMDADALDSFAEFIVPAKRPRQPGEPPLEPHERAAWHRVAPHDELLEQERITHTFSVPRLVAAAAFVSEPCRQDGT